MHIKGYQTYDRWTWFSHSLWHPTRKHSWVGYILTNPQHSQGY